MGGLPAQQQHLCLGSVPHGQRLVINNPFPAKRYKQRKEPWDMLEIPRTNSQSPWIGTVTKRRHTLTPLKMLLRRLCFKGPTYPNFCTHHLKLNCHLPSLSNCFQQLHHLQGTEVSNSEPFRLSLSQAFCIKEKQINADFIFVMSPISNPLCSSADSGLPPLPF